MTKPNWQLRHAGQVTLPQRLHDTRGAGGIGRRAECSRIQRIHCGDVGGSRQQHVDLDEIAKRRAGLVQPGMPEMNSWSPTPVVNESGGALTPGGEGKCWIGGIMFSKQARTPVWDTTLQLYPLDIVHVLSQRIRCLPQVVL
jgi:hypothetical protein